MSAEASQRGENNVEERLLDLAKSQPNGISNDDIKEHMPDVPLPDITAAINKFLKKG